MRASVIIPTYDRPRRLASALECLAAQSCAPDEVIVCDDGSALPLEGVLDRFSGVLLLKYARQEDRGFRAGAARNMGIRLATGDVLIFIDDDVLCPSNFVAAHMAAHVQRKKPPRGRVAIGYRRRLFRVPPLPITAHDVAAGEADSRSAALGWRARWLPFHSHPWYFVYSCNMSIRNLGDDITFDEDFTGYGLEDLELGYRLFRRGYEIVFAPNATAAHVEDGSPRDPFRCEELGLEPNYDAWVRNCVRLIQNHAGDARFAARMKRDLSWFHFDAETRRWRKNGAKNDPDRIIEFVAAN